MAKRAKVPHILIIRLSAMGDVAMTVPVVLALQRNHPEVKVTMLTKPRLLPIFNSLEGISVFSANVKTEHKGVFGLWKLFRELKKLSVTHVADLHHVLRSGLLRFFFMMIGIPTQKIDKGRSAKKKLTRAKNKIFVPLKSTMERYREVFEKLGFPIAGEGNHYLPKQELSGNAANFYRSQNKEHIGIAPFAAFPSKIYRLDLIEEVITLLQSKMDCSILLFGGGKTEVEQLGMLQGKFDDHVQSVAGKLTFKEELALISHLDVMLAMDSGNGHLAANYGVPVVTVWGVTHPFAGFAPYGQPLGNGMVPDRKNYPGIPTSVYGNKYPEHYKDAINSIPPRAVVNKLIEVLERAKA